MQWLPEFGGAKARVAAALARKAIDDMPDNEGRWLVLGRALILLGEFRDAASHLRDAIAILPRSEELRLLLVDVLVAQGLLEEALPHAKAALAIAPNNPRAKRFCLELLVSLERRDGIDLASEAAAALLSSNSRLLQVQAKSLGPMGTLDLCDSVLAENSAHTYAKYLKALALGALHRMDEARDLVALDNLVEISDLPVPSGYADDRSFRGALAAEIFANPTLAGDPRGSSTRDGRQTRQLRQPNAVAVEALIVGIKKAVETCGERPKAAHDGFSAGRPAMARLDIWAVINGRNGRQAPHGHPGGWISGVYYVDAPRLPGENAYRGALIVGAIDTKQHGFEPPWGTRAIEPVPGRLVLFPSYVSHATEPTGIDGARISVAFDVVPIR